ncbi:VOC family protein [Abyssalbus ytuae]|uniref:VOC family protein n=1 Tax=Abyssalbus ytuae TaxID=2926907 RepID=A0A9E6ZTU9_9FLAO|nr:VOC family protein [Abyssalbus ytuae]UOB17698.1 VOC family protein [Abyssalbus ytuae]
MKIEHIAMWVKDLERMKEFYIKFFECTSNDKYYNPKKNFTSYFLSFKSGARLELMHRPDIEEVFYKSNIILGLTHLAISVGSREKVNQLTAKIKENGYKIIGEPRVTGDGYYESVISDPEGNLIEITE